MTKYLIKYNQKGGIDSDIVIKILREHQNLIWCLLYSYMPEFFETTKVSKISKDYQEFRYVKRFYESRCVLTSEIILYFLSFDKDFILHKLQDKFRITNDIDNEYSINQLYQMISLLEVESDKEELYTIWLTNRPGYYSLDHQFIIHRKNNKFNIYQSWINQKNFCDISQEQEGRLYNLNYNQLQVILLNKLLNIIIPSNEQGILQPLTGRNGIKVPNSIQINTGMRWTEQDHQTFLDIPGFLPPEFQDDLIKPMFIFSYQEITGIDNNNLQILLNYSIEKIQSGEFPEMEYFDGKTIEEISENIYSILSSFN